MRKASIWAMAFGLVLATGARTAAESIPYDASKLKSVCVRVENTPFPAEVFGLTKDALGNYAYVWIKGKLPKLAADYGTGRACETGTPSLWITVNIDSLDQVRGYYGVVDVHLVRRTLWETGERGLGIAYSASTIFKGGSRNAELQVKLILDELLTEFAAEYYKAGNP